MNRKTLAAAFPLTVPVLMGYLAIGMAFGLMLQSIGYGVGWALLMSAVIYAGSGQYLGVSLLAAGAPLTQVAFLTLMVNFRHLVYGLSMLEKFRGMGPRKLYMIFSLTDETYALLSSAQAPEGVEEHDFFFTVALLNQSYWVIGSAIGSVLGLTLGIGLSRLPALARYLIPLLSILNTVPGIVFIGMLYILTGMTPATVIIALSIYAMFPVLKNTVVGLDGVDAQYKEAARGCGMDHFQRLIQVELPLAMPTIIGGLRLSTVYTVSWAVLAAMISQGGLGNFIYQGVSSNNNALILQGAIPAAILALILGGLVDLLQKRAVPRGLRKGRDGK